MSNLIGRWPAFPLQILCILVLALYASSGQAVMKAKAKPTQPETQEGVVKRTLNKVSPQAYQDYQAVANNPAERPNYEQGPNYQNPVVRRLQPGPMPTLEVAKTWLQNISAPDGGANLPDASVSIRQSTEFFKPRAVPVTQQYVRDATATYGSIGGGILLEGIAHGLPPITDLQYDATLNAVILNDHAIYLSSISPQNLAVLCRAIAIDDKTGVSIGEVPIMYGKVPDDSQVAIDLKKADRFLANIALGRTYWIDGAYRFADSFVPVSANQGSWIYQANLNSFEFVTENEVVHLNGANFDLRIIPMSNETAPDGGFLADEQAIARGFVSPFDPNMDHLTRYIADYRIRKGYIDRVFRYGEAAAFIRALKADDVDLTALAELIEETSGVGELDVGPPVTEMQGPITRLFAAWEKLDADLFIQQWSPDAIQSSKKRQQNFAELSSARRQLFARLRSAQVWQYEPIYYGFRDDVAYFYNAYRLSYLDDNDDQHVGSGCEIYKVRQESGRWMIIENLENQSCDLN